MNISSNSLFHFTTEIETIKNILSDKFYGSYCKENLTYENEKIPLIIPMISFCDIPLSHISESTKYGKYGIAMKKEWGIKNQLNPVFYLEKNSSLAHSLINAFKSNILITNYIDGEINKITQQTNEIGIPDCKSNLDELSEKLEVLRLKLAQINLMKKGTSHLIYSLYFTKHYSDDLERNGEITKDYIFYDEKEWRYLPELYCAICDTVRTEKDFIKWRNNSANKKKPLLKNINLSFDFNEIDNIIVSANSEKKEIREFIKTIKRENFNNDEREELYSKIISFEDIKRNI